VLLRVALPPQGRGGDGGGKGAEREFSGNLLFTHEGLSGYAALDASGSVARGLRTAQDVSVRVRFFPDRDENVWRGMLQDWRQTDAKKTLPVLLGRELPQKLARMLCAACGAECQASELTRDGLRQLSQQLGWMPFTVKSVGGFDEAMVTSGGVALEEVDARRCESNMVSGLYFAGEVLDVDGPCGGYNLHWAFASGRLAGLSAAAEMRAEPSARER